MESYVLVEMDEPRPGMPRMIRQVIRTYEDRKRADADLELLNEQDASRAYEVIYVTHIER